MTQSTYRCAVAVLLALTTFACSNDPEPQVGQDAGDADEGVADMSTAISDANTDVVPDDVALTDQGQSTYPLIDEAELCDIPANPRLSVSAGDSLHKVTLQSPDAVCNDGSPAILYVRPAPAGSPNADRWVVWLEGGGGCNSAAACADRWCGVNPLFTAGKMSSKFAPDAIHANGIFAENPQNQFADWNQVIGYYCSSDNWTGRQRTQAVDESGENPPFELYFHGGYIVDDLVATLKTGAESDDASTQMPSIDEAAMVLLAGTSAGGGGARFQADRVGEMLKESNADVDYRLVVDAGTYPSDPHPPELSEEDAFAQLDLKQEVITEWRNGDTDASCLEFHADEPRWCAENSHLLLHHITTPWFVKMDLSDNTNSPGPYADGATFSRITFEWYSDIMSGAITPEEAGVQLGSAGLFVPNCGHHVNLEVSKFFDIQISNGNGALSTHDVLGNWVTGQGVMQVMHNPDQGLTSVCP